MPTFSGMGDDGVVTPTPGADDLGASLVPANDPSLNPDEELAAAIDSLRAPIPPLSADEPRPYGMTWDFDFLAGRFRRVGKAPRPLYGIEGLPMWIEAALRTARQAHHVFSAEFGMEDPESVYGNLLTHEAVADFERRMREALLVHDRITAVEDFVASYDPSTGELDIENFAVVVDDGQAQEFGGFVIPLEGGGL